MLVSEYERRRGRTKEWNLAAQTQNTDGGPDTSGPGLGHGHGGHIRRTREQ